MRCVCHSDSTFACRHTGVVVYGKEFFFGGGVGIEFCHPVRWIAFFLGVVHSLLLGVQGGTILGQPHQVQELGETEVPEDLFQEFLIDLGPRFGYGCVCVCVYVRFNAHPLAL